MAMPLENFWLRIIAVIMALLLWFYVVTEKVYKHQLVLPITEITLGERLTLVDPPPDSMTVVVSASGRQLLRRKWRERGTRIQASQLSPGRHVISVTPANTSLAGAGNLITLDEVISPTSIQINIDQIAQARVKVKPDIRAVADEGFTVSRISEPDTPEVTLTGARSLLRKITIISTESIELTALRDNLTMTLPLVAPPGYEMTLEPDSVTVTVEIVAVKTRAFEDIPIVIFNAPTGRTLRTQPPTLRVEITGPPEQVDSLDRNALIASTDFRHRDSVGISPVKIDCPPGLRIKRVSVSAVRIGPE